MDNEKVPPVLPSQDNHHSDEKEVKEQAKRVFTESDLLKGKSIPDKIKVKLTEYFKAMEHIFKTEEKGPSLKEAPKKPKKKV